VSGETEQEVSGWTVDTYRVHNDRFLEERDRRIEQRFTSQALAVDAALAAAKEAVDKAEKAQERRLDLLNEFRAQSSDEQARFATREFVDTIASTQTKMENSIARMQVGSGIIAAGIVGILVKLFTG